MSSAYEFQTITLDVEDGIARLTLNRPDRLNALNFALIKELDQAASIIQDINEIRVLVITGAGRAFCAGGDVKEMETTTQEQNQEALRLANRALYNIANLEVPVITAVNGYAFGAGFSLALAGDIIIASNQAKFSAAFVKVGLAPEMGGTHFLPRLIGLAKAKELVFSGRTIDAHVAFNLGLISSVVGFEEFNKVVEKEVKKLSQAPTKALGIAKKLLNHSLERDLKTSLIYEQVYCPRAAQTKDHEEAVRAFKEKREPVFTGN
ncbi:enoyl-CoA hydratase/isomerase family protein [Neobacillus citreus]|uniref:Enoyl-CoA hydratase-related protein n=1 Tax=Neobacillus citreus TaxID=2833578 RepID=A0A942YDS7_9BACI|nr:enoyl-CoA hydratase-related protein [Neobacillus citreus]MCH6267561.1 enoyl-CoA hydratase-related protein [Neobacillus citreus]